MKLSHSIVSTIVLAVACQTPALAQQASTGQAQSSPVDDAGASANQGDIVVTALRRDQSLLKTPLAISVVSSESLRGNGISSAQNLPDLLPNVQNGVAGFAIRGISSGDFTEKGDPSTAFSLDGIYIARPQQQTLAFFDLERVEVLRGPQGTLYGRNATAGAINVISARPRHEFAASAGFEYGNYDTVRSTAMVNVPLGDAVALRLSGAFNRHDGYTDTRDGHRSLDGRNDLAVRARLLADLSPSTSLLVTADYGRIQDSGPAYIPQARALLNNKDTTLRYQNPGRDDFNLLKSGGVTAELNTDLGFAKLTYLFGYRKSTNRYLQSFGDNVAAVDMDNSQHQDSQELRLASTTSGPLQYVVGLYYFNENTHTAPVVTISGGPTLNFDLDAHGKSYAAFGQATYSLADTVRLVGGLRYTRDEKSRDGLFSIVGGPSFPYDAAVKFGKWTWKAGVEADIAPQALFYASVSTGYKSGGFNDGNPQTQPNLYYDPETITSYEAGLKGSFLANKLYVSASGFYYDYKGLQLSSVPPTGGIVTLNAAKAKVWGLEVEGRLRPIKGGALDFNATYLNATYDRYLPLGTGGPSYAGFALDRSPKFAFRVGYTQDFGLANGGRISANAATKYSSSYVVTDFNVPFQFRQGAYWRTDLSLGYFAPGEKWYLQAFARNLENTRTLGVINFSSLTLGEPRQYGVRAGFTF